MEYRQLQGARINSNVARLGKTASAQRLRYLSRRLKASAVDYRTMGYVTEVKDQVRFSSLQLPVWVSVMKTAIHL